jgi:hypothetical protein
MFVDAYSAMSATEGPRCVYLKPSGFFFFDSWHPLKFIDIIRVAKNCIMFTYPPICRLLAFSRRSCQRSAKDSSSELEVKLQTPSRQDFHEQVEGVL